MNLVIIKTPLSEILPLRTLFLQERDFQIRYNACHERNWTDSYLIVVEGEKAGYGAVKGKENVSDRDAIFGFFLLPAYRAKTSQIFAEFIKISKATHIECQTNDKVMEAMLYEFARNIHAEAILFEAGIETQLFIEGVNFKRLTGTEKIFSHRTEPIGGYGLKYKGEIVATGGFLLHYNFPFADLYMEVEEKYRRKGLGVLLIQELKKVCISEGRIPAARCNIHNLASKATLLKAGLQVCGFVASGKIGRRKL